MSGTKFNFHIKLLSGNNVVMVEAGGYESEIYMPQIQNGRIAFQNIIPNRRCCYTTATAPKIIKNARLMPSAAGDSTGTQQARRTLLPADNMSRAWRMTAGHDTRMTPMASSTPAGKENKHENRFEKPNNNNEYSSQSCSMSIPELARNYVPTPYEVIKDTLVQIPSGIKVIRLHRHPTNETPQRVGRLISSQVDFTSLNSSGAQMRGIPAPPLPVSGGVPAAPACSQNSSDYRLPVTPDFTRKRKSTLYNPTQSSMHKMVQPAQLPASATKWRKCLTPIRTYSRRGANLQKRCSTSSITKNALNTSTALRQRARFHTDRYGNVKPSYMINPTQGVKPTMRIEVKKRKLVIDPKVKITPRSFKMQQQTTHELQQDSKYRLPRTRHQYEATKLSAFELLTNSNRTQRMSHELNKQFRKGCLNKTSTTYPKYQVLCQLPPLERSEETRDIRQQQQLLLQQQQLEEQQQQRLQRQQLQQQQELQLQKERQQLQKQLHQKQLLQLQHRTKQSTLKVKEPRMF